MIPIAQCLIEYQLVSYIHIPHQGIIIRSSVLGSGAPRVSVRIRTGDIHLSYSSSVSIRSSKSRYVRHRGGGGSPLSAPLGVSSVIVCLLVNKLHAIHGAENELIIYILE